jgi:crotonobetainyl-CoA:carnitine CoA-transferase CaiB-like acyl-CoA transferase
MSSALNGTRALAGVRVVDITTSYAGPTATMYLADMGADVVKIERPGTGDDTRHWGPPFLGGESAWFLSANRNKRSIELDISSEQGKSVLHRLLDGADVFIESLVPASLKRLGLAPEQIRQRYPRLVYCAISAFGLEGPDADLPGYDLIAQARSGLMSVTGPSGGKPERVSTALSDIAAGTVAAMAISAALVRQQRDGVGEVLDISLLDAGLSLVAPRIASFLAGESEPRPSGATDSVVAIYQRFATADDPIVLAAGNDAAWKRLCTVLGLDELADDERFATNASRHFHRGEIVDQIDARLLTESASHWLEVLGRAQVPCARVQFLGEVVEDHQVVARSAIRELDHPRAGTHRVVAPPWRAWSDGDAPPWEAAPVLGSATADVLAELGFSPAEITELNASGVTGKAG